MRNDYLSLMTRHRSLKILLASSAVLALAPGLQAQNFQRENEQNRVRENMLDRKVMPFSIIKRRTESAMSDEGSYVGTAPNPREGVYRMQFMRKDGKVIWVDVDGKTGDIIARTR
jgi:hypothetical protein